MHKNPQNLQVGDQIVLTGPNWEERRGSAAVISRIRHHDGAAFFKDERPGRFEEWMADETAGWGVAVTARVMPAVAYPIAEEISLLTHAIREMTENPWPVLPDKLHQQTKPQAYMAQRDYWIDKLENFEPASLPIFIENYPPRTDWEGQPGEPRIFVAPEMKSNETGDGQALEEDVVNHPAHYKSGGLEAITVMETFDLHRDGRLFNAAKYILRAGKKDKESQDIRKAIWYLERYAAALEDNDK